MKKCLSLAILICAVYYTTAQPSTLNTTPLGAGPSTRFEKITAATTGRSIFLYAVKEGKPQFLVADGLTWRDITKGYTSQMNITQVWASGDTMLFVYGDGLISYYNPAWGWTEWPFTKELGAKPAAVSFDRVIDRIVVAGRWKDAKQKMFYAARKDKNGDWQPFLDKKMEPATQMIFDTYTATHIVTSGKDKLFSILESPQQPNYHLMYWNGKEWNEITTLPGKPWQLLADQTGNLYISTEQVTGNGLVIQHWDGKQLREIGKPSGAGIIPKTKDAMVFDKDGHLLVINNILPSGSGSSVQRWDGSGWSLFGSLPSAAGSITYAHANALTTGAANVFLVPEGGQITAETGKRQGGAKDKKVNEVNDIYADFMTNYRVFHQPLFDALTELSKDADKTNIKIVNAANGNLWMNFTVRIRKRIEELKLSPAENPFADYLMENISASSSFYSAVDFILKTMQNTYTTKADLARDNKYVNDMNSKRKELMKVMPEEYLTFVLKNGIDSRTIDYAAEDARIDSARRVTAGQRVKENNAIYAAKSALVVINEYINGPLKQYQQEAEQIAKHIAKFNYDQTVKEVNEIRDKMMNGLTRLYEKYAKELPLDKASELLKMREQVRKDFILPAKSALR